MVLLENQEKHLQDYLNGNVIYMHTANFFRETKNLYADKDIIKSYNETYPSNTRKEISFAMILLMTSLTIDEMELLFGEGSKPKKFGEGKARAWFFHHNGIKFMVFIDNRGSCFEYERFDRDMLKNIFFFLIKNNNKYLKFLNK